MKLPIVWQDQRLGDVSFVLDGFTLVAVDANSLAMQLANVISDDTVSLLNNQENNEATIDVLETIGILIELNAKDLVVDVELEPRTLKLDDLSYGDRSYLARPTASAKWSVLNNLSLRFDHTRDDQNEFALEWLGDINLGGHNGINGRFSAFYDKTDAGSDAYRGNIQFFYDDFRVPFRYELGDLSSFSQGHLPAVNMGGIGISRAYSDLQPLTKISPSNSQEFYLKQSAEVQVIVNDNIIAKVRLSAGRYDLNDLPLTTGENEVEVLAIYANGTRETFTFSTFYNSRLLHPGLSNFHLNIGYPSQFSDLRYSYDAPLVASGFYEYGINNYLTAGVNGLIVEDSRMLGATATLGTSYGNLTLRASHSEADFDSGYAVSVDSEHTVWGSSPSGASNLRISFAKRDGFVTTPWQENSVSSTDTSVTLNYSYYFNRNFDLNFTARRSKTENGLVNRSGNTQFTYRNRSFRASAEYRYQNQTTNNNPDRHQFFLNISWSTYNPALRTRFRADYNGRNETLRANYTKVNRNFHGNYGYNLDAQYSEDNKTVSASASYTGNRLRSDIAVRHEKLREQSSSDIRVNFSTSIAIADGKVGVGNNIRAPFVIVDSHPTLADKTVSINPSPDGEAQALAGSAIGGLVNLGTAFTDAGLAIDVKDAPLGYDWGPGAYNIVGGTLTGHTVTIGSDLSYTAIGFLRDEENNPLTLQRGRINNDTQTINFFTNRKGRFVVEGVGPGEYEVEVAGQRGIMTIPQGENSLIRVGIIKLYGKQPE